MEILRNIPKAEVVNLANLVAYADGQVVSKTLVQNSGLGITLFAFAKDEGIDISETMAFGDGGNDLSMLRAAGVGKVRLFICYFSCFLR